MSIWFFVCVACFCIIVPLHFRSVEHMKLHQNYGKPKGIKIGRIYGTISGTFESIILIGLWTSPQPSFTIPLASKVAISIAGRSIPMLHLMIALPLTLVGAWFGLEGVKATGLETAETHASPPQIIATGVYSIVRHPQYIGWILAHIGISLLLSIWYSLLFTPILLAIIYLFSRKEEEELIKEFGNDYIQYQQKVPMLIPGWREKFEEKPSDS